ncbi:MAG: Arc family DNA-binding protein [Francisellaceae bacterium]
MANFALRLPNSTYEDLKKVAETEGVSINLS